MNWMGWTAPEETPASFSTFQTWLLRVSEASLVAGLLTVVIRPPAYPSKADCKSLSCQMIRLFWSSAAQTTWRETRRRHSTMGLESWLHPSRSPRSETSGLSPKGLSSSAAVSLATLPEFFTLKESASEPRSSHLSSRSRETASDGHPCGVPLVDEPPIMRLPTLTLLLFCFFLRGVLASDIPLGGMSSLLRCILRCTLGCISVSWQPRQHFLVHRMARGGVVRI